MTEKLEILITADDQASKVFRDLGSVGKGILTIGLGAATAAAGALAGGLAFSVKEAMEAQEVQAQLAAVLESTGGAAGVTTGMANGLADSLSKVTRFSDEAILSGENILLTFTNIGKDVFPDTTEVMLDMSQALGQDLKSSAIQLGKALNDPVKGITALTRVGVSFTEEQKTMIEKMVAAGDVMGAQKLILGELQREFGGSAEAAGKTFAGQLDILKNSLSNVAEGVGTAVLPLLQDLLEKVIIPIVPHIEAFAAGVTTLVNVFMKGYESGGLINGVMEALSNILSERVVDAIWDVVNGISTIATKISDFVNMTLIPFVQEHWEEFRGALIAVAAVLAAGAIVAGIVAIAGAIASLFNPITLIIGVIAMLGAAWSGNWGGIRDKTMEIVEWIKPYIEGFLNNIRQWWQEHGDEVIATVRKLWEDAKSAFNAAIEIIKTAVTKFLEAVKLFWDQHGEEIKRTVQGIWDAVVGIYNWFKDQVKTLFDAFKAAQEGDWRLFGEKLREIVNDMWQQIEGVFKLAWDSLKMIVGNLIEDIKDKFSNTDWKAVGKSIIQGVADGITAALDIIKKAAIAAAKAAFEAAKGFLGIESPSTVFAEIGKNMMAGMAVGITKNVNVASRALYAATGSMVYNYNLTIHEAGNRGDIITDFALLKALAG